MYWAINSVDKILGLGVLARLYECDDVIDLGLVVTVVDPSDLISAATIVGWQVVDGEAAFGISTGLELDNGLRHVRALFLCTQSCSSTNEKAARRRRDSVTRVGTETGTGLG